jgi:hypothetical protein
MMDRFRWIAVLAACVAGLAGGCAAPPAFDAGPQVAAEEVAEVAAAPPPAVDAEPPAAAIPPRAAEAAPQPPSPPALVELAPGLRVLAAAGDRPGRVELASVSCLEAGWLEQVACGEGTREHESLVVVQVRPADLHAAMLLAGLRPGRPGRWAVDAEGRTRLDPPTGDVVSIRFRWTDAAGAEREATPAEWIVSERGHRMDEPRWRFGGSDLVDDRGRPVDAGAEGEAARTNAVRYLADLTGSIIGLVTFGDEVIGLEEVIPDAASYAAPAWMVDAEAVPPPGTPVTILLEPAAG